MLRRRSGTDIFIRHYNGGEQQLTLWTRFIWKVFQWFFWNDLSLPIEGKLMNVKTYKRIVGSKLAALKK